jgi:hypothetical protein
LSSLILHPETLLLRHRVERLRRELTSIFDERVRISFEVFPKLRDRYAELFGELERMIQERTLEMSERRRMVELFSLKLDRGQKLDVQTVELVMKAVRAEYSRVRGRMQQAFSDARRKELDDAWQPSPFVENQRETIGGTARRRADEIRELYRFLAKRLHPDAQGDAGEIARHYWDLVQQGYLRGDLPLLRTLTHLIETLSPRGIEPGNDLMAEERRLAAAVRTERAQMEALKRDELYRMRHGMEDEEWIAERSAQLEANLLEIDDEIAKCDRFLAPILSGQKAPPPEIVQSIWSSFVEDMYINNR